jgi:hypothetical protein
MNPNGSVSSELTRSTGSRCLCGPSALEAQCHVVPAAVISKVVRLWAQRTRVVAGLVGVGVNETDADGNPHRGPRAAGGASLSRRRSRPPPKSRICYRLPRCRMPVRSFGACFLRAMRGSVSSGIGQSVGQ